jgi:hypothetical protein
MKPGRRVLLVDKPQRSQTQVYVGTRKRESGPAFPRAHRREHRLRRDLHLAPRAGAPGARLELARDRSSGVDAAKAWTMWTQPPSRCSRASRSSSELLDAWIDQGLDERDRPQQSATS